MDLLDQAVTKIADNKRIDFTEALALYQQNDLLLLASLARKVKERKTGQEVYFNVNRHINLTNVCISRCPLCAFGRDAGDSSAFLLEAEAVLDLVRQAVHQTTDLTEVHMVSALHPDKPFSYYLEIVTEVKKEFPQLHIKAFTPVEIWHFAKISGLTISAVLTKLQAAGLDSLPGGGAEILDDAVREIICPRKAGSKEWIEVITTAHRLGIPTNASMLYGHVETVEQRLAHLFTLRDIQNQTGGFQAFVAFPFHPDNTGLAHLKRVTSWEDLKMMAIARLVLDNIDHIKSFWMMLTLPVAQLSLAWGADDLDGTVVEEKIIHAAGAKTSTSITKPAMIQLIRETGYVAVERDTFYHCRQRYGG
jgi:aminodeoxyfutalosine synthase